jgi:hypothetical protein
MKYTSIMEFKLESTIEINKKGNRIQTYQVDDIELDAGDLKKGVDIKWFADDTEFEIWFPKEWSSVLFPWPNNGSVKRSKKRKLIRKFRGNLKNC